MMKSLLAISAIGLLSQASFALPPKPKACPSVSVLQSTHLTEVFQDGQRSRFVTYQTGSFQTSEQWLFGLEVDGADSKVDALEKGNQAIKSLTYQMGPLPTDDKQYWLCLYSTGDNHLAFAGTPVPPIPSKIRSLIHR